MSTPSASATWRVMQVALELGEPEGLLVVRAAEAAGIDPARVRGMRIARKALDARRRGGARRLRFACNVDLVVAAGHSSGELARSARAGRVIEAPPPGSLLAPRIHPDWSRPESDSVLVVGSGPAGLFAALVLGLNGIRTTLIERGPRLEERGRCVARFHRSRQVDPERNLLFGEGGAGTYSDGKIYTRVDDPLEVPLLEELVAAGAPGEIVYDSLAHIGTDRLHRILPRLRARLASLGVEFQFDTRLEGLVEGPSDTSGARVARAARTTRGAIACSALLLAPGHSARDTWRALAAQGVVFETKPFQLGVRIEHPQDLIDQGRYGGRVEALGRASYNLVCRAGEGLPAAHSFCMCPGGRIVAAVSEPALLCTNGMSNSRHSSAWASAALVTTFGPEHFGARPFDGVGFQADLERRFFEAGGGDYTAPAQTAADFLAGRASACVRHSTYPFGTRPARLDRLLPDTSAAALARALRAFERELPGFAGAQGTLLGLESRSSGPLRMPRERATRRARGWANLYPCGEGAGYAGGIMSAALDGANSALALLALGPPDPAPSAEGGGGAAG